MNGSRTFPEIQPRKRNKEKKSMQTSKMIRSIACTMIICAAVAVQNAHAKTAVTAEEARAIAKEAYVYANPLVDSYRAMYS
jgi:ribosomal protein S26